MLMFWKKVGFQNLLMAFNIECSKKYEIWDFFYLFFTVACFISIFVVSFLE